MPNTWQSLIAGDGVSDVQSVVQTNVGQTLTSAESFFAGGYSASSAGNSIRLSTSGSAATTTSTGSRSESYSFFGRETRGPLVFSSVTEWSSTYTTRNADGTATLNYSQSQSVSEVESGSFSSNTVFATRSLFSTFEASERVDATNTNFTFSSSTRFVTSSTTTRQFLYSGIGTFWSSSVNATGTIAAERTRTSTTAVSTFSATVTGASPDTAWTTTSVSATRTFTTVTTTSSALTQFANFTTTYRVGSGYPVPVISATGRDWLFAYGSSFSGESAVTTVASSFSSSVFSRTMSTFSHAGVVAVSTLTSSSIGVSFSTATRTVTAGTFVTAAVARPGERSPATATATVTLPGRTTRSETFLSEVFTTNSTTYSYVATRTYLETVTASLNSFSTSAARYLLTNGSTSTAAVAQTFTTSSTFASPRRDPAPVFASLGASVTARGSRDFQQPETSSPPLVTAEQAALDGGYRAGLSFGTDAQMGSAITASRSYFLGALVSSRAVSSPTEFHEQFGISTTQTGSTSVTASVNSDGAWQITTADTSTSETFTLALGLAGVGSKFSQTAAQSEFFSLSTVGHGAQRHSADSTFVRLPPGLYRFTALDSAGSSTTTATSISGAGLTTTYAERGVAFEQGPVVARGNAFADLIAPNSAPYFVSSHADL